MDIKEAIALVADGENLNMEQAGAAMDEPPTRRSRASP